MIHIVIGTKAQLIKMAPVMKELADRGADYNFIFTGQHKETIQELIGVFNLKPPDYTLYSGPDITKIFQMLFWILRCLARTIKNKSEIFENQKGIVLVHGDTASTLLGTLMAKIAGLKIGYVEAGLRSFRLFSPFPEELVRRIVSRLADYHFCPGAFACGNSGKYIGEKINTEENTLLDSLSWVIENENSIDVNIPGEKYCLVSIHRFENIFNRRRLADILGVLKEISGIKILFILHKPTKEKLIEYGFYDELEKNFHVELRPRYDYFRFIKLLKYSEFIITDGGSNQEESYYLGKPCLVMRATTERREGLDKNVVISGYDKKVIGDFIANYQKHKLTASSFNISPFDKFKTDTESIRSTSPSKIIVDCLINFST